MPYILKRKRACISKNERPHGCWHPIGLLVQDGSIWQCGKCKRYWERRRGIAGGWVRALPGWEWRAS